MSTYGSHPEQMTVKLTVGDGAHLVATSANGWSGPVSLVWGPADGQWTEETSTLTDVGTVDGTEVSWTLTVADVTARSAFPYVRLVDNGMTLQAGDVIPWTGGLGSTVTQTIASLTAGPPGPTAVSADADNVASLGSDGLIYVPPGSGGGGGLSVIDNGDGTLTISGDEVTDNGDGTLTVPSSEVTDNGDGTLTFVTSGITFPISGGTVQSVNGIEPVDGDITITAAAVGADPAGTAAGLIATSGSLYAAEREDYVTRLRSLKVTSPSYNLIDDFASAAGWSNGTATTIDGSTVLQWTNGTGNPARNYGAPLGITADQKKLYLRFHVAEIAHLWRLRLYFYDSTGANGYVLLISAPTGGWDASGWQTLVYQRSQFTVVGSDPGWAAIERMSIISYANAGQPQPVVAFDEVALFSMRPVCSIWFDDGHATVVTEAEPRMTALGFVGSLTVVGTGGEPWSSYPDLMSHAQLRAIAAAGWDLSNHTYTHPDLETLDEAGQRAEIARGLDMALKLSGGAAGAYHFVPPMARENAITRALAREYATIVRDSTGTNPLPVQDLYHLGSVVADASQDVSVVTGHIDQAIANQEWLILLFHQINEAGTANTYQTAKFQAVLDYLALHSDDIDTLPPTIALARM